MFSQLPDTGVLSGTGSVVAVDGKTVGGSAADIIRGKGDYVLGLKENHPEVYSEVRGIFPEKDPGEAEYTETARYHGRIEKGEALFLAAFLAHEFEEKVVIQGVKTFHGVYSVGKNRVFKRAAVPGLKKRLPEAPLPPLGAPPNHAPL